MFPDSILVCDAIFLLNGGSLFFICTRKIAFDAGKKAINVLKILSIAFFLLGTLLNIVQVIIRYWYREVGYYQFLWHIGMTCFYLSIFIIFVWMIAFIFFQQRESEKK